MSITLEQSSLLLTNARVVLPEGVLDTASVLIEGGRIVRVSARIDPARAADVQDLHGLTLFPGFIDLHIHGAVGVDTMEATSEDFHRLSQFLALQGVTGWLPTLVPAPDEDYKHAVAALERTVNEQRDEQSRSAPSGGARILGVHYEGPFVNEMQCGALRSTYLKTFSQPADLEVLPTIVGTASMVTIAPEIDGGVELVKELVQRGWVVSVGHTRASVEVLHQARAAGARHMTHFMNAMPSLHHRNPGPVAWGLTEDSVSCDVIADGIHLDPLILSLILKLKTPDRLMLISDAIAAAGKGDGEYKIWGETITVKEGRTSNARGSIAGSVITMLDAARMMSALGATPSDIARMTASNPARLLRMDDRGTIEEGKRADLVALDDAGNVRLTIVGGRVAYQS